MTDRPETPQQYWQIQLPCDRFPKSQFQFDEQVALCWVDERGVRHRDIGKIVGMQFVAEGDQPAQWYYRIRYLKCDHAPWLVGTYDEYFEEESRFVADDTVIED